MNFIVRASILKYESTLKVIIMHYAFSFCHQRFRSESRHLQSKMPISRRTNSSRIPDGQLPMRREAREPPIAVLARPCRLGLLWARFVDARVPPGAVLTRSWALCSLMDGSNVCWCLVRFSSSH